MFIIAYLMKKFTKNANRLGADWLADGRPESPKLASDAVGVYSGPVGRTDQGT